MDGVILEAAKTNRRNDYGVGQEWRRGKEKINQQGADATVSDAGRG